VKVVFHRSRLQQRTTGRGRIMAVGLSHDAARALPAVRDGRLSIAACNSPSSVALVGELKELEAMSGELQKQNVFCRVLHGQVPYHSRFMDPLEDEIRSCLADLAPRLAAVPIYSTVTGKLVEGASHDGDYWWRNVRSPVLFADAIKCMSDDGFACFLELSPHPVLAGSVEECLVAVHGEPVVLPSLHRGDDDRKTLLGSLGALYSLGCNVAWAALNPSPVPHADLPGYPWQRESYWFESDSSRRDRLDIVDHPLLGRRVPYPQPAWQLDLNRQILPYLADHRVMGAEIFPGAGYAEMALAATVAEFGEGNYALEEMRFRNALFMSDDHDPTVLTTLDPRSGVVEISSRNNEQDNTWVVHATVRVRHI
jgi:acyl transferase domain-containing protein